MESPAQTKAKTAKKESESGEIKQRIQIFLGEFRILVPAMGALLGFQLTSAFSNGWSELAEWEKILNLTATSSTAIALGFLLLPANYHRVTADVQEDEDFLHFAQRSFGFAFLFVGLGMAGSLFLQARRVTHDPATTAVFGAAFVLFFILMWGILPKTRAARHARHEQRGRRRNERSYAGSGGK